MYICFSPRVPTGLWKRIEHAAAEKGVGVCVCGPYCQCPQVNAVLNCILTCINKTTTWT